MKKKTFIIKCLEKGIEISEIKHIQVLYNKGKSMLINGQYKEFFNKDYKQILNELT